MPSIAIIHECMAVTNTATLTSVGTFMLSQENNLHDKVSTYCIVQCVAMVTLQEIVCL